MVNSFYSFIFFFFFSSIRKCFFLSEQYEQKLESLYQKDLLIWNNECHLDDDTIQNHPCNLGDPNLDTRTLYSYFLINKENHMMLTWLVRCCFPHTYSPAVFLVSYLDSNPREANMHLYPFFLFLEWIAWKVVPDSV